MSLTHLDASLLVFVLLAIGGLLVAWGLSEGSGAKPRLVTPPIPSQQVAARPPQPRDLSAVTASSARTKFCRHCGAQIPRDSKFCEECGATLKQ